MAQVFPAGCNVLARALLAGAALLAATAAVGGYVFYWSPIVTQVGVPIEQPVPFSHKHHVAELGIDCRYCHTGVEKAAFAGLPPTETCMTCHSQVWRDAPMLEPVRQSWARHEPLRWTRVNDLPDYVFFNHAIHIQKGVGCVSCHGRVDEMPLTAKGADLSMRWCLECHRSPEKSLRPAGEIFNPDYHPPPQPSPDLARDSHLDRPRLEDCSTCHR